MMIHLIEDVVLGEISTLPRMPLVEDFRSRYREYESAGRMQAQAITGDEFGFEVLSPVSHQT